jgi:hypothetical protein
MRARHSMRRRQLGNASDEARGRFRTEWRRDARTQGASFGGGEFPLFTSNEKNNGS